MDCPNHSKLPLSSYPVKNDLYFPYASPDRDQNSSKTVSNELSLTAAPVAKLLEGSSATFPSNIQSTNLQTLKFLPLTWNEK